MKYFALIVALLLSGCQDMQQAWSHTESSFVGLNRHITLFSADGHVVREWDGRFNIETKDGMLRFLSNGKAVIVQGTYVVEEK